MLNIYLGGNAYGFGNIGDDAILQGLVFIIQNAVPDSLITVGTKNGNRLNFLSNNIRYISCFNIQENIAAIKGCDLFVSGGGTMIGDENTLSFPLEYNLRLISIAKLLGKRVAMLAIGANRLRTDDGSRLAKNIIKLCDMITVRDNESVTICTENGAKPDNVFKTADPAFLLKGRESKRTKELKKRIASKGKVFGVNVTNEAWKDIDGFKIEIAKVCDTVYSEYGYMPVFFCNEVRDESYYDHYANKQTASFLKCDHVVLEPIYYTPEEMIDVITSFEFVLGLRMHALIFAALANKPFVAVSRVDKVDNFMNLFGLESSANIEDIKSDAVVDNIQKVISAADRLKDQISKTIPSLRKECLKNISLIENMLSNKRVSRHRVLVSSMKYLPVKSIMKSYLVNWL